MILILLILLTMLLIILEQIYDKLNKQIIPKRLYIRATHYYELSQIDSFSELEIILCNTTIPYVE